MVFFMNPANDNAKLYVQVLFTEGCPNYQKVIDLINEITHDNSISINLESVLVNSLDEARLLEFLGSPTIRVNGLDIEPGAWQNKNFGLI